MADLYTRQYPTEVNWENFPKTSTPLSEANLRHMDNGITRVDSAAGTAINHLNTTKANQADALLAITGVSFDVSTGKITFTRMNTQTIEIDTALSKVATNWTYDSVNQRLVLTLADGTTQNVDLSDLIQNNEFLDSTTIAFTVGTGGTVTANIIDGSITGSKLQPDYLADVTTQASNAAASAASSQQYSLLSESYAHGGTNLPSRPTENVDNAQYYKEKAEQAARDAEAATQAVDFIPATDSRVGTHGLVPAPPIKTANPRVLGEDGWENAPSFNGRTGAVLPASGDYTTGMVVRKNLLGYTLESLKAINTAGIWNGNAYTYNGVTFTVNDDLSVTVNGTATANVLFLIKRGVLSKFVGRILNGCPVGGGFSIYYLRIDSTNPYTVYVNDNGAGTIIPNSIPDDLEPRVSIIIYNGYTASNLIFRPMIRDASIADDTYEPYREYLTNEELSEREEIHTGEIADVVNVLGAKNLLPFPYYHKNGHTNYGVTYTVNNDGSITVNGTASSNSYFELARDIFVRPGLVVSGLPEGIEGFCAIQIYDLNGSTMLQSIKENNVEINVTNEHASIWLLGAGTNVTRDNVTCYPMIRPASIEDDTYVPYAKTNRELTEEIETKTTWEHLGKVGAKNLLGSTHYNNYTLNGITANTNPDGSISFNGTATAEAAFEFRATLPAGERLIMSGCPTGGSATTYRFVRWNSNWDDIVREDGNGVEFTNDDANPNIFRLIIISGYTASNLTFYPMIRSADDPDPTYQPYTMTNQELTKKVSSSETIDKSIANNLVTTEVGSVLDARMGKALNDRLTRQETYSTDEQVVGTWIDSKPIYKKTIIQSLSNATAGGDWAYNHGISNFKQMIKFEGHIKNNNSLTQNLPFPYTPATGNALNSSFIVLYYVDSSQFHIFTGTDRTAFTLTITLYYTKTTD